MSVSKSLLYGLYVKMDRCSSLRAKQMTYGKDVVLHSIFVSL